MLTTYMAVAIGGALGSVARFAGGAAAAKISQSLPWGTILINIVGSFVIGFFGTLTLAGGRFPVSENWRVFVMVGLCGGFTTFSAFSLQTLDLLRAGQTSKAAANVVLSVLLCLLAVAAGHALAAKLNGGAIAIAQARVEDES